MYNGVTVAPAEVSPVLEVSQSLVTIRKVRIPTGNMYKEHQ